MSDVMHGTYLPFTREQVLSHVAKVGGKAASPEQYLSHFTEAIDAYDAWQKRLADQPDEAAMPMPTAKDIQIEKDERFWTTAALIHFYHRPDRVAAFAELLAASFGGTAPPVAGYTTWQSALGDDVELYFEVNLPSPPSYKAFLSSIGGRVITPTLKEVALRTKNLEGTTKADAVLVSTSTGFAVVFEAKVTSDVSTSIRFDVLRNQLARVIDVTLDRHTLKQPTLARRLPEQTCVVLLTPELFRQHKGSRLYSHLMDEYRGGTGLLAQHLPHRTSPELGGAASRLGWVTWEDIEALRPGGLRWLLTDGAAPLA